MPFRVRSCMTEWCQLISCLSQLCDLDVFYYTIWTHITMRFGRVLLCDLVNLYPKQPILIPWLIRCRFQDRGGMRWATSNELSTITSVVGYEPTLRLWMILSTSMFRAVLSQGKFPTIIW